MEAYPLISLTSVVKRDNYKLVEQIEKQHQSVLSMIPLIKQCQDLTTDHFLNKEKIQEMITKVARLKYDYNKLVEQIECHRQNLLSTIALWKRCETSAFQTVPDNLCNYWRDALLDGWCGENHPTGPLISEIADALQIKYEEVENMKNTKLEAALAELSAQVSKMERKFGLYRCCAEENYDNTEKKLSRWKIIKLTQDLIDGIFADCGDGCVRKTRQEKIGMTQLDEKLKKVKDQLEKKKKEWEISMRGEMEKKKKEWEISIRGEMEKEKKKWEISMRGEMEKKKKEWEISIRGEMEKEKKKWEISMRGEMEKKKKEWEISMQGEMEKEQAEFKKSLRQAMTIDIQKECQANMEKMMQEKLEKLRDEFKTSLRQKIESKIQEEYKKKMKIMAAQVKEACLKEHQVARQAEIDKAVADAKKQWQMEHERDIQQLTRKRKCGDSALSSNNGDLSTHKENLNTMVITRIKKEIC